MIHLLPAANHDLTAYSSLVDRRHPTESIITLQPNLPASTLPQYEEQPQSHYKASRGNCLWWSKNQVVL